jgi:hypothetical protein
LFLVILGCKKEITKQSDSQSMIKFMNGGQKDKVTSINKTKDGGFIYCGYSVTSIANIDAFLLKTDADGNQNWYKNFGGSKYDKFNHVIQTSDGGFLAAGTSNSFNTGINDTLGNNLDFIVKLDGNGNITWAKSYMNTSGEWLQCAEASDGHFYLTGRMSSGIYGAGGVTLLKVDVNGSLIYLKNYSDLTLYPPKLVKTSYYSSGLGITFATNGSLVIGGVMSKSIYFNEASNLVSFLMFINQTDGTPTLLQPYYNYVRGYQINFVQHLQQLKIIPLNNGFMIGTYFEDSKSGLLSMELIKTNSTGEVLWEKKYFGLGQANFMNIEQNPDNTFLLVGNSSTSQSISVSLPELFYNLKTMLLHVDEEGNVIDQIFIGSDKNVIATKCVQKDGNKGWNLAGSISINELIYDKMTWCKVDLKGNIIEK